MTEERKTKLKEFAEAGLGLVVIGGGLFAVHHGFAVVYDLSLEHASRALGGGLASGGAALAMKHLGVVSVPPAP